MRRCSIQYSAEAAQALISFISEDVGKVLLQRYIKVFENYFAFSLKSILLYVDLDFNPIIYVVRLHFLDGRETNSIF